MYGEKGTNLNYTIRKPMGSTSRAGQSPSPWVVLLLNFMHMESYHMCSFVSGAFTQHDTHVSSPCVVSVVPSLSQLRCPPLFKRTAVCSGTLPIVERCIVSSFRGVQ